MLELAEAIDVRRSTRQFDETPIDEEDRKSISRIIEDLKSLEEGMDIEFHFIDNGSDIQANFKGIFDNYFKVKAPAYIAITALKCQHYLENAGYMGEELVLKLTQLKIGTCWVGSIGEKSIPESLKIKENHEYIITIALGYCDDEFYIEPERKSRKTYSEFVEGEYQPELITVFKSIEKAPSAMNSQPWVLLSEDNMIHFYLRNPNIFTKKMLKNFNHIDMGIAMKHFEIEMNELGKEFTWENLNKEPFQTNTYIYTAIY